MCTFLWFVGAAAALLAAEAQPVVQFDVWGTDSIRVRIAPAGGAIVEPPVSPLIPPPAGGASARSAPGEDAILTLTSGNLVLSADAVTGFVTATRVSDGATLFTTSSLAWGAAAPGSRNGSVSVSLVLAVGAANKLYGLGEHGTGSLDMTGYSKKLEESQYYPTSHGADILIPFYMAIPDGVGLLWALPSYGAVDLAPGAHNWTSSATLNVDLWVTTTPAPGPPPPAGADPAASGPMASLLRNYVDAVGHAPPMPEYVAGFWQCKNRYRNQSQVLAVARGYRDRGLPLDIITIDYLHWANFGDWSFNPACFPDPAGMVQELQDMGVELAVTFWPMVTPSGAYFSNFSDAGYFLANRSTGEAAPIESWAGPMYCVDETNAAARAAIYAAFRAGYGRYGIRTVWLDGSEPERSAAYNFGAFRLAAGTDSEVGEAWTLQHVRAMAEGFAADGYAPDEFFLLPRSTWAGAQRYSAGVWSGDIASDWATLAQQVVIAQGMGLSGHALWTNDGGGYAGGDPASPGFQELVVRWLQASVFFPIMRLHGQREGGPPDDACGATGGDNELWTLAPDAAHYDALVAAVTLRAALRDYTLRINRVTAASGLPMVRAMALAFPADAAGGCGGPDVWDQWMYGPDYLVGPVLAAGQVQRSVYLPALPAGETWVYHWNGTDAGPGGGRVIVNTSSLADYPVFVRTPVPPPPGTLNVSSLWSAERADLVTCASAACYAAQAPGLAGNYTPLHAEGLAWDGPGPAIIAGAPYALQPLGNYWSPSLLDNACSLAGAPGPSYTDSQANGYVLAAGDAPGAVPLLLFTRTFSASHVDTAAVASAAGLAWVQSKGYTAAGSAGWVLPATAVAA